MPFLGFYGLIYSIKRVISFSDISDAVVVFDSKPNECKIY